MGLGKQIRLNRIFSHPSGNLCSIAVDHLLIYNIGMPPGLRRVKATIAAVVDAQPDAVTIHKGIASSVWKDHAGKLPLILQSSGVRPDDTAMEQFSTVEDAVRLGADAMAVVAFVHGKTEAHYLRVVSDCVRDAVPYDMPIISHVYPRDENLNIIFNPEDIAWAVRCMVEVGADIVKVPYCGDKDAHAQIVAECPVPVVAAGGPKTSTMLEALQIMADAVSVGVRGGTIGRNVWGNDDVTGAVRAYKAVIHEGKAPEEALQEIQPG
jgi:class I fructose-bisphosphate aldolase